MYFVFDLSSFISLSRSIEYPSAFLSGEISSSTKISSGRKGEKGRGKKGKRERNLQMAQKLILGIKFGPCQDVLGFL